MVKSSLLYERVNAMAKKDEDDFYETERVSAFTLMPAELTATIKKRFAAPDPDTQT
jgi:hypothetical protein